MTRSSFIKKITKTTIALIFIASLAFLTIWLWQRQPSPRNIEQVLSKQATSEAQVEPQKLTILKPKDFSALNSPNETISGKTQPNSFAVIFSNNLQIVTPTDKEGNFQTEMHLTQGLNLINIEILSSEEILNIKDSLTIFVSSDNSADTVFAGPVKSIFDTLITVTTSHGQKNIRSSKNTPIELPTDQSNKSQEAAKSPLEDIRVGDYVIALGKSSDSDTLIASTISVQRDNKPQNSKNLLLSQIQNSPSKNIFQAKDLASQKVLEFTLTPETQLLSAVPLPTPSPRASNFYQENIKKNHRVIIIYQIENNKNIANLIYLLP